MQFLLSYLYKIYIYNFIYKLYKNYIKFYINIKKQTN